MQLSMHDAVRTDAVRTSVIRNVGKDNRAHRRGTRLFIQVGLIAGVDAPRQRATRAAAPAAYFFAFASAGLVSTISLISTRSNSARFIPGPTAASESLAGVTS